MNLHKLLSIYFSICLIIISIGANAQVPQKWYFGQNAAIDFTLGPSPIAFVGSLMNTPAGCAVSKSGIFYSNGQNIWAGGGIINNGIIDGNMLASQSVAIVELTKTDSIYVFTTDAAGGAKGLKYHVIDKPNGQYTVVSKNHNLLPRVTEKLAVTIHCNKHDYWVLTHGWNDNIFYAYHLDEKKLDTIPVTTQIGSIHGGQANNAAGYLKFNRQATKVAAAITGEGKVELFEFDNVNGTLSNPITINNLTNAYGVEFDYSGTILYVSTIGGYLYQFDISQWNQTHIINSRNTIASDVELFGALQLGPDNRIYLSRDNASSLAAVTLPQTLGSGCNYVPNFVFLKGGRCEAGLPQIFPNNQQFDVKGLKNCLGDTSFFSIIGDTTRIDSVLWNFGDSLSLTDTSTLFSPSYIYPIRTVYKFQLIIYHCGQADTLENYVEIFGPPHANLGPDTTICSNTPISLFPGYATTYLWQDSATVKMYLATDTGVYYCKITNTCGEDSDTMRILAVNPAPVFSLPHDTILCDGDSVLLISPFGNDYTNIWVDSINAQTLMVKRPGLYSLLVIDSNNCKNRDDILISFDQFPMPYLGEDTFICIGQRITFNGNYPGSYLWNNGSTNPDITTYSSGTYIINITNACGTNSDTINLEIAACDQVVWVPNAFTPNSDGLNDVFLPYTENVYEYKLMIFDRWGKLIFETTDPSQGWDGKYKNKLLPGQVYSWKMIFKDYYNKEFTKYGMVVLIR